MNVSPFIDGGSCNAHEVLNLTYVTYMGARLDVLVTWGSWGHVASMLTIKRQTR